MLAPFFLLMGQDGFWSMVADQIRKPQVARSIQVAGSTQQFFRPADFSSSLMRWITFSMMVISR